MARYVKEFANATMLAEKYIERCPAIGKMNEKIRHIVGLHDKGMITDFEAVKQIVCQRKRRIRENIGSEKIMGRIWRNPNESRNRMYRRGMAWFFYWNFS